ncbi:MAG: hypothetical protein QW343_01485 [Candidatus Norongarragalinales archaeon]
MKSLNSGAALLRLCLKTLCRRQAVRRMPRGQAGVEFMTIVGLLGLMLLIVFAISFNQRGEVAIQSSVYYGWSLCQQIASEVNTAVGVGDGFERIFYLPLDVNGEKYSISIAPSEQAVFVSWAGYSCRAPLVTSQLTGSLQPGANKVKNNNGSISFSQ